MYMLTVNSIVIVSEVEGKRRRNERTIKKNKVGKGMKK